MNKYHVTIIELLHYHAIVEANSEEEAKKIADIEFCNDENNFEKEIRGFNTILRCQIPNEMDIIAFDCPIIKYK